MPFTPFHFGPAFLAKPLAPRRFWLTSFVLANVVIDVEVLYFLRLNEPPWHRYLHTYVGGFVVGLLSGLVMWSVFRILNSLLSADSRWYSLVVLTRPRWDLFDALAAGMVGGLSHVFLDSLMHSDMNPFWPFANGNALVGLIGVGFLHIGLAAMGLFGLILMALHIERETS